MSLKLIVLCIYRENKRERGNFLFVREEFVFVINFYNKWVVLIILKLGNY